VLDSPHEGYGISSLRIKKEWGPVGSGVISRQVSRLETVSRHGFSCLGLGSVSTLVLSRLGAVSSVHVSSCLMSHDCAFTVSVHSVLKHWHFLLKAHLLSVYLLNNNLYLPWRQKQYTKYKRVKNYKTERKTVARQKYTMWTDRQNTYVKSNTHLF